MRLRMKTHLRIGTVMGVLFAAFTFPVLAQTIHEDPAHGFVIEVPDGWHPVPEDFLAQFSRMVSGQTGRVNYVAGFQQRPFAAELERPYFLIQVLSFQDLGIERPITDGEAEEFVEILTGLDGVEILESSDSEYIHASVAGVTTTEKPAYDPVTRAFTYTLDTEIQGVGLVRGAARGMLGKRAMVQTIYYALKDNWEAEQQQASATLASFALQLGFAHGDAEPLLAVPPSTPESTVGSSWLSSGINPNIYIVLGVVVVTAAATLVVIARRSKPQ